MESEEKSTIVRVEKRFSLNSSVPVEIAGVLWVFSTLALKALFIEFKLPFNFCTYISLEIWLQVGE